MYCHNCGKENVDDAKFCFGCGSSLQTSEKKNEEGSKSQRKISIALIAGLVILFIIILIVLFWKKTTQEPIETTIAGSESRQEKESEIEMALEPVEEKITIPFSTNQSGEISTGISPASFVLPESNSKVYSADELNLLSAEQLRLARNEIFARHGRNFKSEDLQEYFGKQPWYTSKYEASEFDALGDSIFNEFEIANRKLIISVESNGNTLANNTLSKDEVIVTIIRKYGRENYHIGLSGPLNLVDKGTYFEVNATISKDTSFPISRIERMKIGDKIEIDGADYYVTEISTSDFNPDYKYYSLALFDDPVLVRDDIQGLVKSDMEYRVLGSSDVAHETELYTGKVRILKNVSIKVLISQSSAETKIITPEEFFSRDYLGGYYITITEEGYISEIEQRWSS